MWLISYLIIVIFQRLFFHICNYSLTKTLWKYFIRKSNLMLFLLWISKIIEKVKRWDLLLGESYNHRQVVSNRVIFLPNFNYRNYRIFQLSETLLLYNRDNRAKTRFRHWTSFLITIWKTIYIGEIHIPRFVAFMHCKIRYSIYYTLSFGKPQWTAFWSEKRKIDSLVFLRNVVC